MCRPIYHVLSEAVPAAEAAPRVFLQATDTRRTHTHHLQLVLLCGRQAALQQARPSLIESRHHGGLSPVSTKHRAGACQAHSKAEREQRSSEAAPPALGIERACAEALLARRVTCWPGEVESRARH